MAFRERRANDPLKWDRPILERDPKTGELTGLPTRAFQRQFNLLLQDRQWALVDRWDFAVNGSTAFPIDFLNIGGTASEIFVISSHVTKSASGIMQLRVSVDGGATFLSTSGDYETLDAGGAIVPDTELDLHTIATSAARNTTVNIRNSQTGTAKVAILNDGQSGLINTSGNITALRLLNSAGGNATGGFIEVLVR